MKFEVDIKIGFEISDEELKQEKCTIEEVMEASKEMFTELIKNEFTDDSGHTFDIKCNLITGD